MPDEQQPSNKTKFNLSLDLRVLVWVLLGVIVVMLALWAYWKPWDSASADDRTVSVTGEATVTAEPDEYVFSPSYRFQNADKDTALAELTKKSDAVVSGLKDLGVPDNKIKTNSNGYDTSISREPDSDATTYTLRLTVTVADKDLAQKVQDYLLTTSPTGSVTPQVTFSDAKQRELESEARDKATEDARAKAEQSADNLGFSVGKVKEVSDGSGFNVFPMQGRAEMPTTAEDSSKQLSLQPGENDLNYSVTVVYYVK